MSSKFHIMARTVKDYIDFLDNVIANIPNQIEGIIDRNEFLILELNRKEQLYKGKDSNNKSLFPEYKPITVQIKRNRNQPYDRVTLFDSGAFYRSFYVEFNKNTNKLTILANDAKTPLLVKKYGENILGLTNQHKDYLENEVILEELRTYILQYL